MSLFIYQPKQGPHYNVLDVAQHCLYYAESIEKVISNLQLQKILYYIQAAFLINMENPKPCFNEDVQAWKYGPVIEEAYRRYAYNGSSLIYGEEKPDIEFGDEDRQIIENVCKANAVYTPGSLINATHKEDPWIGAYEENKNNVISNESIQIYFQDRQEKIY